MVPIVLNIIAANTEADAGYHEKNTPDGSAQKYTGKAVLLRCTNDTFYQGFNITAPPDTSECSNWDKFCSGPFEVVGVEDTDHISLAIEPRCRALAERMAPYLDSFRK